MSPELLERCYLLYAISGYTVLPDPVEVLLLPVSYIDQLLAFAQGVKWVKDVKKFEAHIRKNGTGNPTSRD